MRVRTRSLALAPNSQPSNDNVSDPIALLSSIVDHRFRVLVADPPWKFGDKLPGDGRGAANNYACMSIEELARHEIPPVADDCVLFLWRVASMVDEAQYLARAWGFTPRKGEIVWRKLTITGKEHFGMGRIVRGAHETCLLATRGRPEIKRRDVRSIFSAPVPRDEYGKIIHSAKPPVFFSLVRTMYDGPRASIFERTERPGFQCFGNQMARRD